MMMMMMMTRRRRRRSMMMDMMALHLMMTINMMSDEAWDEHEHDGHDDNERHCQSQFIFIF